MKAGKHGKIKKQCATWVFFGWVCAAQRGRDFEAPDLERGIHFRGVF